MSNSNKNKVPLSPPSPPRPPKGGEVGDALKSVYDRALNEAIPPDLLDLLGKLD